MYQMQPRTVVPFMRPKKSRPEQNIPSEAPAGAEPAADLDDLEAHISQRINQLQTDDPDLGVLLEDGSGNSIIVPFEPFEGYDFNTLTDGEAAFTGAYEKVADGLRDEREVLKSLHALSDLVTDSLLNLNVRLNELDERLKEVSYTQTNEIERVRNQLKDLQKTIPTVEALAKLERAPAQQPASTSGEHPVSEYMNELQRQVTFLKERMDRNVVELAAKTEERQTAFLNMLDTRVKVMEKISLGYKDSLARNFFNLALLVIIIVVIAGAWISNSVDHMSNFVSQQLDALRTETHDLIETTKHQP
jgi:DNA repair exonuclease SbcCD ATPase subunit